MNFNVVSTDHTGSGELTSPLLYGTGTVFVHTGVPDTLIAYGGCPILNGFDLLQAIGPSTGEMGSSSGAQYVLSQNTVNTVASTARVILSGFSFSNIRDAKAGFPMARVEHLRDILTWFQNIIDDPIGIGVSQRLVNYLGNAYPNPFNRSTTIMYGIKERAHVTLRVYNVAGQLVKTLVNDVKTPRAQYTARWEGDSNAGQPVASGVYFYRLVTKDFVRAKKMILLK
jgi:hypothetical protein